MTDKAKIFWAENTATIIIFLINIIFLVGMYFGVLRTQLDAKVDKEQVRQIVKEEITNKFSITDGEVLKVNFQNLNEKLDKLEQLMLSHTQNHK